MRGHPITLRQNRHHWPFSHISLEPQHPGQLTSYGIIIFFIKKILILTSQSVGISIKKQFQGITEVSLGSWDMVICQHPGLSTPQPIHIISLNLHLTRLQPRNLFAEFLSVFDDKYSMSNF